MGEPSGSELVVRRAGRVLGAPADGGPWAIVVRAGRIERVVRERDLRDAPAGVEVDAAGGAVLPGFVDAHTHLVFAGDRLEEFRARLDGRAYDAGGIRTTVAATRAASDDELVAGVVERATRALRTGTTTIEVKSGYGLSTEHERRCLQAIHRAGAQTAATLVPTFLGAHLVAHDGYVDEVVEEMLPVCAPLARWCDAFCDEGALDVEQTRRVLTAARERHGLGLRVHAEQLTRTGAAQLAAALGCASADHLARADGSDARALAAAGTVAVLLPASSFCGRYGWAPARTFLDAGATIALATDCNPGTSNTTSMAFVIAVACAEYGLTADEAVTAATAGGAAALQLDDVGRVAPGCRADLVVLGERDWAAIAYHPGEDVVAHVVKDGALVR